MDIDLMEATPGSDYALDNGCKCPVVDNCHGKGIDGGEDFWINPNCPVHTDMPEKDT